MDFGWHAWVDETALRDLELRFFHLAPQAVHCALATVEPHPRHGHKWADGAWYVSYTPFDEFYIMVE